MHRSFAETADLELVREFNADQAIFDSEVLVKRHITTVKRVCSQDKEIPHLWNTNPRPKLHNEGRGKS